MLGARLNAVLVVVFLTIGMTVQAQDIPDTTLPVRPVRHAGAQVIAEMPDSIDVPLEPVAEAVVGKEVMTLPGDSLAVVGADTLMVVNPEAVRVFNPDPTRAVWLSALCPGLGQLYNRRYWKLPIVIGGFMGLGYATSWNNTMLRDYTRAYFDIMDSDPATKSYMDFFAPTIREEDIDKNWLSNIMKSRKDFYRRNRDLCIIAMVGVYLIAMVDAYVDAQLAHFDITPTLTVDMAPALMPSDAPGERLPAVGLQWALNF